MKNLVETALRAVLLGLIVYALCWIIGGLPHFDILRIYAWAFGLIAGVLLFIKQWDWRMPL